jgi:hypothetical protein
MQQDPTTGVRKAKPRLPRLKPAKEEIPRLSREYLEIRNRQMRAKALTAEMEGAARRGELIERKLVEFQAAYLLLAMRARMFALPQAYAGRLVGLTDAHEVTQILRAAMIELLDELKDLPARITDKSWLERVTEEQQAAGGDPPGPEQEPARAKPPRRRPGSPE